MVQGKNMKKEPEKNVCFLFSSIKSFSTFFLVEEFVPSVIEPSFGIGRIMYAMWEHNFRVRPESEQRTVS